MKIEVLEIKKSDIVMVSHNIGYSLPPSEVDSYCETILPSLKEAFHGATVVLLPVREGETWEFTIIRQQI
jgi:hypothetical protein